MCWNRTFPITHFPYSAIMFVMTTFANDSFLLCHLRTGIDSRRCPIDIKWHNVCCWVIDSSATAWTSHWRSLRPLQVDSIFAFIRQVAPVPSCWLFKTGWPFDLERGVRVTCDLGYLFANFSLPRPLCSRVRSDVRDRYTYVRQKHRIKHNNSNQIKFIYSHTTMSGRTSK